MRRRRRVNISNSWSNNVGDNNEDIYNIQYNITPEHGVNLYFEVGFESGLEIVSNTKTEMVGKPVIKNLSCEKCCCRKN